MSRKIQLGDVCSRLSLASRGPRSKARSNRGGSQLSTLPKVSVIIPTYNCARFIGEAVRSVLVQSFRDFELLVIDDGSTDNTEEVIQPYRRELIYLAGPNRGAAAARNAGLRIAQGDLIAFLDADDLWHRDKIKEQVALMDANPEIGV